MEDQDYPNQDNTGQQALPEDDATPFSPAAPVQSDADDPLARKSQQPVLDDTHQATDSNVQPEEAYEEGVGGAAEASEPNKGDSVVNYDPAKDQRKAT